MAKHAAIAAHAARRSGWSLVAQVVIDRFHLFQDLANSGTELVGVQRLRRQRNLDAPEPARRQIESLSVEPQFEPAIDLAAHFPLLSVPRLETAFGHHVSLG